MPTTIPAIEDAQTLAQAIVDTIHEPLIVLDGGLRVLAASRAFYDVFKVDPEHTMGCLLYDLGDGQWNIPALRLLLVDNLPVQVVANKCGIHRSTVWNQKVHPFKVLFHVI